MLGVQAANGFRKAPLEMHDTSGEPCHTNHSHTTSRPKAVHSVVEHAKCATFLSRHCSNTFPIRASLEFISSTEVRLGVRLCRMGDPPSRD